MGKLIELNGDTVAGIIIHSLKISLVTGDLSVLVCLLRFHHEPVTLICMDSQQGKQKTKSRTHFSHRRYIFIYLQP